MANSNPAPAAWPMRLGNSWGGPMIHGQCLCACPHTIEINCVGSGIWYLVLGMHLFIHYLNIYIYK